MSLLVSFLSPSLVVEIRLSVSLGLEGPSKKKKTRKKKLGKFHFSTVTVYNFFLRPR